MNLGRKWNFCCQVEKEHGEAMLATIGNLSTQCSGFYERVRLGGICRQVMGIGKTRIVVFAVGATKAFGSDYWNN